ncbi:MAG TPA: GNAT family N-acetyltransferase [Balneolales bacterium]|nr:GNAT family N-acetyltransferase [Balneolales bacterium]
MKDITIFPVTSDQWQDFRTLFGTRGACGGCWCMYWRLSHSVYQEQKGDKNRNAMSEIIHNGTVPGIIGYIDEKPVGWCSVAPRDDFPRLERSRILKKIDDNSVWSIVCLFVDKSFRNRGISVEMLKAAVAYVKDKDGKIVEGYPVEPKKGKDTIPPVFAYTGIASAFIKAGFREVERRSETRPIMRYYIED